MTDRRPRGFEPQVLCLLLHWKKAVCSQGGREERGFVGLSLPVPAASQGTIDVGARASPMGRRNGKGNAQKVFESVFDKAKDGGGGVDKTETKCVVVCARVRAPHLYLLCPFVWP